MKGRDLQKRWENLSTGLLLCWSASWQTRHKQKTWATNLYLTARTSPNDCMRLFKKRWYRSRWQGNKSGAQQADSSSCPNTCLSFDIGTSCEHSLSLSFARAKSSSYFTCKTLLICVCLRCYSQVQQFVHKVLSSTATESASS